MNILAVTENNRGTMFHSKYTSYQFPNFTFEIFHSMYLVIIDICLDQTFHIQKMISKSQYGWTVKLINRQFFWVHGDQALALNPAGSRANRPSAVSQNPSPSVVRLVCITLPLHAGCLGFDSRTGTRGIFFCCCYRSSQKNQYLLLLWVTTSGKITKIKKIGY